MPPFGMYLDTNTVCLLGNTGLRQESSKKSGGSPEPSADSHDGMRNITVGNNCAGSSTRLSPVMCSLSEAQHDRCTFAPSSVHELMKEFEERALSSYIEGSPQTELLIKLSRINVLRAAYDNAVAIGMTVECMCQDDTISIFSCAGPNSPHEAVPLSLRATSLQQQIPHHPWLDIFPFPRMRDNLILAGNALDDDELCHDLTGFWDTRNDNATLLVWGTPWDPQNWEVTEAFARKWGWLLQGCPEILISTNKWRVERGEKLLRWRQIFNVESEKQT